jgi:hypothetical protein
MRKIEQQMLDMIHNKESGICGSNTFVEYVNDANPYGDRSEVYLHGHHIASYWYRYGGSLEVNERTLLEYPTATTKSRLKALGANVKTSKGKVYLDNKSIN